MCFIELSDQLCREFLHSLQWQEFDALGRYVSDKVLAWRLESVQQKAIVKMFVYNSLVLWRETSLHTRDP